MITKEQCRAARALLDWSRDELAARASVNRRTIADFETGTRKPIKATNEAMQRAFEDAGVGFDPAEATANGVWLR